MLTFCFIWYYALPKYFYTSLHKTTLIHTHKHTHIYIYIYIHIYIHTCIHIYKHQLQKSSQICVFDYKNPINCDGDTSFDSTNNSNDTTGTYTSNNHCLRSCSSNKFEHFVFQIVETIEYTVCGHVICKPCFDYSINYLLFYVFSKIISELGLNGCVETRIGGNGVRGVSGGERKRVSIGIELLTNPRLLFLVCIYTHM